MSWTGATPTRGAGRIVTSGAAVMQEIQLIEVSDTEVIRAAHGKSTHTHELREIPDICRKLVYFVQ